MSIMSANTNITITPVTPIITLDNIRHCPICLADYDISFSAICPTCITQPEPETLPVLCINRNRQFEWISHIPPTTEEFDTARQIIISLESVGFNLPVHRFVPLLSSTPEFETIVDNYIAKSNAALRCPEGFGSQSLSPMDPEEYESHLASRSTATFRALHWFVARIPYDNERGQAYIPLYITVAFTLGVPTFEDVFAIEYDPGMVTAMYGAIADPEPEHPGALLCPHCRIITDRNVNTTVRFCSYCLMQDIWSSEGCRCCNGPISVALPSCSTCLDHLTDYLRAPELERPIGSIVIPRHDTWGEFRDIESLTTLAPYPFPFQVTILSGPITAPAVIEHVVPVPEINPMDFVDNDERNIIAENPGAAWVGWTGEQVWDDGNNVGEDEAPNILVANEFLDEDGNFFDPYEEAHQEAHFGPDRFW